MTIGKRGRGRPRKQTVPVGDPEFFEIFLPDRISHQLCIPHNFIKNFDPEIPEAVILKDLSGRIWHVNVKQDENGVFLKGGWNKFVNEKNLEIGHLMVFRYSKNSLSFTVRIFGKDACIQEKDQDSGKLFNGVKTEQGADKNSTRFRKSKRNCKTP